LHYIASAGQRSLMVAAKQARASKSKIGVALLQPVVKEIFTISRFSFVVPVWHDTKAEALAKLG